MNASLHHFRPFRALFAFAFAATALLAPPAGRAETVSTPNSSSASSSAASTDPAILDFSAYATASAGWQAKSMALDMNSVDENMLSPQAEETALHAPEPNGLALIGTGTFALAMAMWQRRRA